MSKYEATPHEQRQADREAEDTGQAIAALDELCPHLAKVKLKPKPGPKRGSKRRRPFSGWRNELEAHLL